MFYLIDVRSSFEDIQCFTSLMSGGSFKDIQVSPHWCQEGPPGPTKKSESGILIQENWTPYLQLPNVQFLCNNWALLPITCHQPLVIRYLHHIRLIFVSMLSIFNVPSSDVTVFLGKFSPLFVSDYCLMSASSATFSAWFDLETKKVAREQLLKDSKPFSAYLQFFTARQLSFNCNDCVSPVCLVGFS